ncbi:MAG TPA: acyltransferase family protein [Caulobacteraceae bacterium]|nr:acyltransferase family protein [Caulobacteraceae bacterium]
MQAYRRDIDGLRAVAVLSVVAFHALPPLAPGGYVGVDVFFVISGYLITSIVWREAEQGRFSLRSFYDRRVRRIFPALFFMLAVAGTAAVLVLIPSDLEEFGKTAAATTVFLSNVVFWLEGGYFAGPAHDKPLLHTWSLAVEEQFYLFWPIILWVFARASLRRWFPLVFWILFAGSLIAAEVGVRANSSAPFYLFHTRAWELLAGAALALGFAPPLRSRPLREAAAATGALLIAAAVFGFGRDTPFPGLTAAVPCLGTALVIWAGRDGDSLVGRALGLGPVVFVGLISYSLYLWHWPVLVLGRLWLNRPLTDVEALAAVAVSVVAAVISWRFVERPFRKPSTGPLLLRSFAPALGLMAVLFLAGSALHLTGGLPGRAGPGVLSAEAAARDENPLTGRCHVHGDALPPDEGCRFGPSGERARLLLWGDSHGNHYAPGVAVWAERARLIGRQATKSACAPLVGAEQVTRGAVMGDCVRFNARMLEQVRADPNLEVVVLAGRWSVFTETVPSAHEDGARAYLIDSQDRGLNREASRRVFDRALARTVDALLAIRPDLKVVVLGQTPEFDFEPSKCFARARFLGRDEAACAAPRSAPSLERLSHADAALRALSVDRPRVTIVLPSGRLCDVGSCRTVKDDVILFRDDDHLTAEGSRRLLGGFAPLG